MAIRTAATARIVVRPAISIIRRTRANSTACSIVGWGTAVSVMQNSSSNIAQRLEVTVAGDEGSPRLDRVLAVRRPELSRSRLKALIVAGQVSISKVSISKVSGSKVSVNSVSTSHEPDVDATAGTVPIRDPAYHVAAGD